MLFACSVPPYLLRLITSSFLLPPCLFVFEALPWLAFRTSGPMNESNQQDKKGRSCWLKKIRRQCKQSTLAGGLTKDLGTCCAMRIISCCRGGFCVRFLFFFLCTAALMSRHRSLTTTLAEPPAAAARRAVVGRRTGVENEDDPPSPAAASAQQRQCNCCNCQQHQQQQQQHGRCCCRRWRWRQLRRSRDGNRHRKGVWHNTIFPVVVHDRRKVSRGRTFAVVAR